jgi:methionyl-tRNA synthetase
VDAVLWASVEVLRVATVLLSPVMPRSTEAILERLDAPVRRASELRLDRDALVCDSGVRQIVRGPALWPRREEPVAPAATPVSKEIIVTELPKDVPGMPAPAAAGSLPAAGSTAATAAATAAAPPPPTTAPSPAPATEAARLSFDQFMQVDLRVARVVTAERVPKSKKLLKLGVDVGSEQRTIVAGLGEVYEPDTLIGRSIVIVANLEPAKLMGIESNGMVLAATAEGGKPVLLGFDQPPAAGSRIR